MTREEFAKIYAYDCIINQLSNATKDPRKRERIRAKTAQLHINEWYKEGEDVFERRNIR